MTMFKAVELRIDVTEAAGLGTPATAAITAFLPAPEAIDTLPVICFGFPGGGYSRRYYSFDMPDGSGGGEAGFHCDRGWIFIACDHLGFGDSTIPDGNALDPDNVAKANDAVVKIVMGHLENGTLAEGFPPVLNATKLGIGQSMGGCFTIVALSHFSTFDGVGILGYSAIHTVVPTKPGAPQAVWPWISRRSSLDNPEILNLAAVQAAEGPSLGMPGSIEDAAKGGEHPFQWSFHYDDEPADIVALDMAASAGTASKLPEWRSATTPACGVYMIAPGAVSIEAAGISVPVLVAVGERDVVPDPWAEPKHTRAPLTSGSMWRRAWGICITSPIHVRHFGSAFIPGAMALQRRGRLQIPRESGIPNRRARLAPFSGEHRGRLRRISVSLFQDRISRRANGKEGHFASNADS